MGTLEETWDTINISESAIQRIAQNVLKKLNVDATGRLRVAAESNANITTVTNVTNCPNIGATTVGPMTSVAWMQLGTMQAFDCTFKRNLVRT